jgi:predicted nucleic acid-binding protein
VRYWDSCAIIPLCVDDDAFTQYARGLAESDDSIATWWGTPVECCSAFARLRREGVFTAEEEQYSCQRLNQLTEVWGEVLPSEKLRSLARKLLLRQAIRSADALQLAAAIIWAGSDTEGREFVSLDRRLREAAQSEGFVVVPNLRDFNNLTAES